jgi:ribosomal protein S12 methylthiotransferase accessory factor YcaO
MRPPASRKHLSESSDQVGLIVALLVRFPEIATLVSHPSAGTLTLSFAIARRLERAAERALREAAAEHVGSLLEMLGEQHDVLEIACECDAAMTFVRVTRDARSFSRDELQLLTALLAQRFGPALLKSQAADDETSDDDPGAQDDLVDFALEALRDPSQQRSLVGFREEKRVLVYFVKAKKAKARARS